MVLLHGDRKAFAHEALVQENLAVGRRLLGVGPVDLAHRPVRIELVDVQVGLADRPGYAGVAPLIRRAGWGFPIALGDLQGGDAIDGGRVVPGGPVPGDFGGGPPGGVPRFPGDVFYGGVIQAGRAPDVQAFVYSPSSTDEAQLGVCNCCAPTWLAVLTASHVPYVVSPVVGARTVIWWPGSIRASSRQT